MSAIRNPLLELANARQRIYLLMVERDDPELTPARRAVIDAGELRMALAVVARLESEA